MSMSENLSGHKNEILKYLDRYETSWVVQEIMEVNEILSKSEKFMSVLIGIAGVIGSFALMGDEPLAGLLGILATVLLEYSLVFVHRLRRLKYFVKAENLIFLEEIKRCLMKDEEQKTEVEKDNE